MQHLQPQDRAAMLKSSKALGELALRTSHSLQFSIGISAPGQVCKLQRNAPATAAWAISHCPGLTLRLYPASSSSTISGQSSSTQGASSSSSEHSTASHPHLPLPSPAWLPPQLGQMLTRLVLEVCDMVLCAGPVAGSQCSLCCIISTPTAHQHHHRYHHHHCYHQHQQHHHQHHRCLLHAWCLLACYVYAQYCCAASVVLTVCAALHEGRACTPCTVQATSRCIHPTVACSTCVTFLVMTCAALHEGRACTCCTNCCC
jgi:hypothetical protein